jgi:hypothetical protein
MSYVDNRKSRPVRRPPLPPSGPPAAPSPDDLAWEGELIQLLSTLEAYRTLLADRCVGGHAVEALETMLATGGHLVAFAESRLDTEGAGEAYDDLRARAEECLARARKLHARLNRTALKTLLRMLGRPSEGGDPHAQFVDCAERLGDVLAGFFGLFTDCFERPEAAHDWADTSAVFLAEVAGLVEQLRT